jgi:predicted outer membrane repeat protein
MGIRAIVPTPTFFPLTSKATFNAIFSIIDNSTINNNNTKGEGGAIYNVSSLTLNDSTLSGNSGNGGGAIYSDEAGALTLNNSTVSNNNANYRGGIRNYGGILTLNNSTVSNNSASSNEG